MAGAVTSRAFVTTFSGPPAPSQSSVPLAVKPALYWPGCPGAVTLNPTVCLPVVLPVFAHFFASLPNRHWVPPHWSPPPALPVTVAGSTPPGGLEALFALPSMVAPLSVSWAEAAPGHAASAPMITATARTHEPRRGRVAIAARPYTN